MTAIDDKIIAEALGVRVVFFTQPPKVELEMPLRDAPGWRLGLLILVYEGSLVVAEVKVFPDGDRHVPPRPANRRPFEREPRQWSENASALMATDVPTITARMLRSIKLGEIIATLREHLETQQHTALERSVWAEVFGSGPSTLGEPFAAVLSHSPSRSHQGDEYLAQLARPYSAMVAAGSKHPIQDLADELGVKKPSHVRDAIFRAREKGYLTRSLGPRPGGSLTQAGRDVLQRASQATGKSPTGRPRRGATAKSPFVQSEEAPK